MEEVDMVLAHQLDELTVDILQGLIVCLQGFDQLRLTVDHFFRHHCIAYPFKSGTP